jgi:hypothetical protein
MQVTEENTTSIKKQALGAVLYGYNPNLISTEYSISIDTLETAHTELRTLIKAKNLDTDVNLTIRVISDLETTDVIEIIRL